MTQANPSHPYTLASRSKSLPASQNLPKSMVAQTHGRKESTGIQHCIKAIAGEVVKLSSVHLINFGGGGQVIALKSATALILDRYQELYWAGQDENWDYADYQIEKIETALKNGFERRPKRAESGTHFMNYILPEMKKTIQSRDTILFNKNFVMLTSNCNSCHTMEKVPFFTVSTPTERQSPIKK